MQRWGLVLVALALALGAPRAARADDEKAWDYAVDDQGVLYRIACAQARVEEVGRIEVQGAVPRLWDLAATPDGYLYGIADDGLYLINVSEPGKSVKVGDPGVVGAYGMSAVGPVLLINTRDNQVFLVDRKTAQATPLGAMGGGWSASGDIALVGEEVYSSVKDASGRETLVRLDPKTGQATQVAPLVDDQQQNVEQLYGLITREGVLYGLSYAGDLLRIDERTGHCTTLSRTGIHWYGATDCVRF